MLTRLKGGRIVDPMNGVDGEIRDLYIRGGRIVAAPEDPREADTQIDVSGRVVMAGAILAQATSWPNSERHAPETRPT